MGTRTCLALMVMRKPRVRPTLKDQSLLKVSPLEAWIRRQHNPLEGADGR